jgi:Tfp pilus assembly protein PilF
MSFVYLNLRHDMSDQILPFILADIQQIENISELIFSIAGKCIAVVLAVIAIAFVWRVLASKHYSIRQINIPASFEEAGHSGNVIANRIYHRISEILLRVSATEFAKGYSTYSTDNDVSVDVGGMGMPIKGFIELIGGVLGIRRNKRINIDIFKEGERMVMMVYIAGAETERFETALHENIGVPIAILIAKAAETILKHSNDEALQVFFAHVERNGEQAVRLAKYRYEKYRNNTFMEARMVSAWARGLALLKKYDEAEAKIKEGIRLNPNEGRLYNVWGLMLQEQSRHEEAKAKLMKAISLMKSSESKFRRSNVLTSIGVSFSKLGEHQSALTYYKKAIDTDSNANLSYFYWAKSALLVKNDTSAFYELLEKSLARGLRTQLIFQDVDLRPVLNDSQMKALLEKYTETA